MASKNTAGISRIVSRLKKNRPPSQNTRPATSTSIKTSSGGSMRPTDTNSNVEIKYYKSDGTPVFGSISEKTIIPSGSKPNQGANIEVTQQVKAQEKARETVERIGSSLSLRQQQARNQELKIKKETVQTLQRDSRLNNLNSTNQPLNVKKLNKATFLGNELPTPNLNTGNQKLNINTSSKSSVQNGKYGGRELRADTKPPTLLSRSFSSFKESILEPEKSVQRVFTTNKPTVESAVATSGLVLSVLPFGAEGKLASGAKSIITSPKVVRTGKNLLNLGTKTGEKVVKFGKNLAIGTGISTGVGLGIQEGSTLTLSKEQREIVRSPEFKESFKQAVTTAEENAKQKGFFRNVAQELTFGATDKKVFSESFKNTFGDNKEALNLANRQRNALIAGEVASLLSISTFSERIGQKGVTEAFELAGKKGLTIAKNKLSLESVKLSTPSLIQAGFIEGFGQEIGQQALRKKDLSLKEAGKMGLFGSGSATVIGNIIIGTTVTKPSTSKAVEFVANIADPFEKPGDILAGVIEKTGSRISGKTIKKPIIRETKKGSDLFKFDVALETPKKSIFGKINKPKSAINNLKIFTPSFSTNTKTSTNIYSTQPNLQSPSFGSRINMFTQSPIGTPTPSNTPSNILTPVTTNTNANTFSYGFNEPTEVFTNTNTFIPSLSFNVPTTVPVVRIPPPAPLAFPFDFAGNIPSGRKGSLFVNELNAGLNILSGQNPVLFGLPKKKKNKGVGKMKSKRKGKGRK